MTQAYPLQWPAGKPRTANPQRSRFQNKTINVAVSHLMHQLTLMGNVRDIIISTNLRLRLDGLPYSDQKQPADKGAAIYFKYKGQDMVFACAAWDKIEDNIYAVAMTIEALRGIERWGSGDMMQQAFTGFVALEAPGEGARRRWWQVLGVDERASLDTIRQVYRNKARSEHPDKGGSDSRMADLNTAYNEALKVRGAA